MNEKMAIVRVTPTMAQEWLDAGKMKNRPVSLRLVQSYADQMKSGRWKVNGESIKIGKSGVLIDGQHRCRAVVLAGVTVPVVVIRDLDEGCFPTIDCGKKRTGSDVLAIAGRSNTSTLAAAARWYLFITGERQIGRSIGNDLVLDCVEKHPLLEEWAIRYSARSKASSVFFSACLAVFCLMEELHGPELAADFFEKCVSGEGLSKGNPAYELRERLLSARATRSQILRTDAAVALTIKAANAYLRGDRVGVLRLGADESYPSLVGYDRD